MAPTVFLVASCLASVDLDAGEYPFFSPVQPPRQVQVVARVGALKQAPENTSAAIEYSIADTVEWVQVDVRLTRDGHHVLMHDSNLDRTTEGTGPVGDHSLAELRSLDPGSTFARRHAGTPIPTLADILRSSKDRINLELECKQVDPARLVREVLDARMERQVVVSAPLEVLQSVRSTLGGERLALMPEWRPSLGTGAFSGLRPAAVKIGADIVTSDYCRAFHDRGIKVQATTLGEDDRPAAWDHVIASGCDWLLTDHAEEILAHQVLRRAGPGRVKVAHHRGASRYAPENTLPAFEKAIRLGADFVEFDVRTSQDGAFFLLHDSQLDRTTTAHGPIRDHGSNEIGRLDAGVWFGRTFTGTPLPTLDAFLDTVGSRVELYVDAKDIAPHSLVAVLRAHNVIDRAVVYQRPEYLARLREIEPGLRRMPPLRDSAQIDALADRVRPYAFDTDWRILSKRLIDRCHEAGIKVFSDALGSNETVDSYRRAIADGIDLIQTDYPIRVLRAVELIDAQKR
jgi:glycerophosphoryl diester phosphodiesterase